MSDDNNKSAAFNAALPLPNQKSGSPKPDEPNPAADLIRKKVEAAYTQEPDLRTESKEVEAVASSQELSRHQKFIYELTSAGKPLKDIQAAWHEYYVGLTDLEKHQVWQEFYDSQKAISRHPAHEESKPAKIAKPKATPTQSVPADMLYDLRNTAVKNFKKAYKPNVRDGLRSLMFGLTTGVIVMVILLFGLFNERFIAPLIQPSRQVNDIPLITSGAVSNKPEIIIPKINVQIPVVYGVNTVDDSAVQKALENGVVHYADTAMPGQNGNLVIVGHSSNNIFNPGKYKFAFVLLSRLENGDTFYIQKDGKRYTYQVYVKKIVPPTDVSVLGPADKPATATLITCDPPGTSINRLVVTGVQISPDPSTNVAAGSENSVATSSKFIPGNAPSLWSRMWSRL